MIRLTLVAAVFAAICSCFVVSASARDNHMQMYSYDGTLAWEDDREEETVPDPGSVEDRLIQAKQFFDKGLISEKEYQTKKSEILKSL